MLELRRMMEEFGKQTIDRTFLGRKDDITTEIENAPGNQELARSYSISKQSGYTDIFCPI